MSLVRSTLGKSKARGKHMVWRVQLKMGLTTQVRLGSSPEGEEAATGALGTVVVVRDRVLRRGHCKHKAPKQEGARYLQGAAR